MAKPLTDQEILEKAIQKAIDGGWSFYAGVFDGITHDAVTGEFQVRFEMDKGLASYPNLIQILYSHDFAKALWGEEMILMDFYAKFEEFVADSKLMSWTLPAWQYHLQQMVIAEDPIQYLGENI